MERYWKNSYVSSGLVLLAFSLVVAIASRSTMMLGLIMIVPSILLIGYGKRQVDGVE